MNPFVLLFADGTVFFVGLAFVLVAEGFLFRVRSLVTRFVLKILTRVGILLVILSATPLPLWAYAIWMIPALAGLYFLNRKPFGQGSGMICLRILLGVTILLCVLELPHHRRPLVRIPSGASVYVLGDSISAGMGSGERPWPDVLDEMTPFRIINLAQPGATVKSAFVQAKGISGNPSLVILEIGGNDLLGDTAAKEFHLQLNELVQSLRAEQHEVLLFELPLYPFRNAYGKAQRDVARKHDVTMLPKRFFAKVLGTPDGTLDGLHLSQEGHNAMANIIADVLQ